MLSAKDTISGVVSSGSISISGSLSLPDTTKREIYDGDYEITPLVNDEISMNTRNKVMTNDVSIHKVPSYIVSNIAGGNTFYIGE